MQVINQLIKHIHNMLSYEKKVLYMYCIDENETVVKNKKCQSI